MALKNIGIEAGAGCGKTTRITKDILDGLSRGDFDIDNIVVITFTRKAANELKSRISLKLQEAIGSGDKRLEEQLKNIGNARISTIHSFCEGLLKERPVEAGVDPGFKVIDEIEQGEFLDEVYDVWLQERLANDTGFFKKIFIELGKELKTPENPFNSKDSSFQGIVKTALEHRELELFVPARPEAVNVQISRFATKCTQLRDEAEAENLIDKMNGYIQTIQVDYVADPETYLENIKGYKLGNTGGGGAKDLRNEWKTVCEEYVSSIRYAMRYPEIRQLYDETNKEVLNFIEYYREAMREYGVMDFNEILFKTEILLAADKDVRKYFKNKFAYIFVDEFQDTDPLQVRILFYLAERKGTEADRWEDVVLGKGKIYVVGDPKQSIFRFRRADIEIYTQALEKITAGEKEFLSVNYRSSGKIIDWVNAFFEDRIKKPANGYFQADYVALKSHKKTDGEVIVVEPDMDPGQLAEQNKDSAREIEAKMTAAWIQRYVTQEGGRYSDVMVLFKTKSNMQRSAEYLEELDIPYEMVGSRSFFGRGEVLDITNMLKALANPLDRVSVVAALKGPFYSLTDKDLYTWSITGGSFDYRGIGETQDHATGNALKEMFSLQQKTFSTSAYTILLDLIEQKGIMSSYAVSHRGQQKLLNILKAVELLKSFGKIPFCDAVDLFVEKLEKNVEMADFSPRTGEANAVQLMSVHKAKGLEEKVVYIADSTSNNIIRNDVFIDNIQGRVVYRINKDYDTPEFFSWKDQDLIRDEAESERLRYVAATRAKERLVVNMVPFKGFEKTFIAPFSLKKETMRSVKLDISNLTVTYGRQIPRPKSGSVPIFEKELNRITVNLPKSIEIAATSTLPIHNPSIGAEDNGDIKIEILYDPNAMNYNIEGVSAATIGSLAHRLMEINPYDLPLAARTLVENEKAKVDPEVLAKIAAGLQKEDLVQRVEKSKNVMREVPIKFKTDEGLYYDGTIDLLFEEEDGWVLVDYKAITIANKDDEVDVQKKYQGQLQKYAEGLKQVGLNVKESLLVSR